MRLDRRNPQGWGSSGYGGGPGTWGSSYGDGDDDGSVPTATGGFFYPWATSSSSASAGSSTAGSSATAVSSAETAGSSGHGSGLAWWAYVLIAAGAVVAILFICALVYHIRRERRLANEENRPYRPAPAIGKAASTALFVWALAWPASKLRSLLRARSSSSGADGPYAKISEAPPAPAAAAAAAAASGAPPAPSLFVSSAGALLPPVAPPSPAHLASRPGSAFAGPGPGPEPPVYYQHHHSHSQDSSAGEAGVADGPIPGTLGAVMMGAAGGAGAPPPPYEEAVLGAKGGGAGTGGLSRGMEGEYFGSRPT
ncbi:hypothetical protein NKR23_g1744 [Pleurostoma richardsiae]|uniref:Uncharacterized protein n=1 Tax=Pleurostoma richardsiae TaxID=41990 RepID=A0AA38RY74_9PEZI|nr:hypothetical protein NKR23_g1744 [Pleurostoma richardsiae]